MRLPNDRHLEHAWRVTTLAADFELLDVWRYPLELEQDVSLAQFGEFMQQVQRELVEGSSLAGGLFRLRGVLGRVFGLDDSGDGPPTARPIPGCSETSLRERLPEAERPQDAARARSSAAAGVGFEPVYAFEDEFLLEISNKTVHALMHVGRVPVSASHWSPQMAVYVKPRARTGRLYMRLIGPFRHGVVYPAMMRSAKRAWPEYAARHLTPADSPPRRAGPDQ